MNTRFVRFNRYKNKVIEFYGDYWHKNPKKFPKNKENIIKWKYDAVKEETIKKNYDLLIVWESDYVNDSDRILDLCMEYLG